MYKMKIYRFLLLTIVTSLACAQNTAAGPTTILVMGDSLSAGYGIDIEQGWVNLLEKELTKKHAIQIISASVSGETSSGGNTRLPALLAEHTPDIVILELGGNDGLRGQPLKLLEKNLQAMIDASKKKEAQVLLAGMQIPPNYGARYGIHPTAEAQPIIVKNVLPELEKLLP